ncbi:MAG: ABC transporter permease [Thermoprotei archaeon]|nr:MAG: ABC transporter permease [Thermoprotei archaeon]
MSLKLITFIADALRLAFKVIKERKLRAALTMLGIMIGPLVMVMMGSVVAGYSNYIVNQIASLGQNAVVIYPSSDYKLTQDDLNYIRSFKYVEEAEPFYVTQGIMKRSGEEVQVYVYAVKLSLILKAIGGLEIMEGSVPPESDILGSLIGYKIAFDEQGNRQCSVDDVLTVTIREVQGGRIVRTRNVNVMVVGVLKEYGGALIFSPDQTIFLNFEAGKRLLGMRDWSGIFVLLKDSIYVNDFTKELRDAYGGRLTIVAFGAIAKVASSITAAISFINFTTSLSALAVAVAGITATMVTSVIERTREIGVMKAVGFTNTQVIMMILAESLAMSLIGGSIGITLGVAGAYALASQGLKITGQATTLIIKTQPALTPDLFSLTLGLTVLVGIIGGLLPAYMASKIPPAVALRYE